MKEKKTAEKKPGILNKETGEIKSPFDFYKFEDLGLQMKKGEWFLSMLLDGHVPKLYMHYIMRWTVDLSNIEKAIEDVIRKREEFQDSLILEEDEIVKENLANSEAKILAEKAKMIEIFKDLEFECSVEKMANKMGKTQIVFNIPSNVVEQINAVRMDAEENYKISLNQS